MIQCQKCGKELEDGTRFCDDCGTQVFETIFCPNCGEQTSSEFAFCQQCGAAITEEAVQVEAKPEEAKSVASGKKALSKRTLFIGGGIAVVVILAILISALGGKGGSKGNYGLYLKDREIVYTNFTEKGTQELTSRLTGDLGSSESYIAGIGKELGDYIAFSKDGKRVFYPDRLDSSADGVTLYYRDINKPKAEPVKIDSDIQRYAIDDSGSCVVYSKGSDGILYRHNLKDKEKIASDVVAFKVTSDCKKIGYRNEDGSYYIWYANKDTVKLASDISYISYITEDISTIYYVKDDGLYKQVEGDSNKEKIASDVSSVVKVYDTGEIYYIKTESEDIKLMDYVVNDTDATSSYDSLLDSLRDAKMETTQYTLYYYDGKDSTVVTDALTSNWADACAADKPVAIVSVYNQSDIKKVKLSEISSIYEVRDLVEAARYSSSEYYVVTGDSMTVVDQTEAGDFVISSDGSLIYFLDDISNKGEGDLYKITVSKNKVGSPELYDTDVSSYGSLSFISDNKIAYFKDVDTMDYKGDLIIDKAEVDYDVNLSSAKMVGDSVLYYTDWNSNKYYGILCMFKNGKKTKVADDVHDYITTNNDDILYLYDYSTNHYNGTLYLYRNGKAQKLDDDVSALIPVSDTKVKGAYYGW